MRKAASLKKIASVALIGVSAVAMSSIYAPTAQATQKVSPILECIDFGKSQWVAVWGYNNPNNYTVTIPIGSNNKFAGSTQNMGQPTEFKPGRNVNVFFTTQGENTALVWQLNGKTATAGDKGKPCNAPTTQPTASPIASATVAPTATPTATPTPTVGGSTTNVPTSDGLSDGLGCSVRDCSGNQVGTPAVGEPSVLGTNTGRTLPVTGSNALLALMPAILLASTGLLLKKLAK